MKKKILAFKGEMETFFDKEGRALAATKVVGKEDSLGEIFKEGERITVRGVSKGKGFAGVVKRHHFKGGPRTHGQSDRERAPGSIGSTTTPGRVLKGKRMAGRMGSKKITVKNLKILKVDAEKNWLYLQGAVPGVRKGIIELNKSENA
ncbi:MAG: 50S ribosomal protein L3 [Microgenomates group bacterium]